MYHNLVVTLSDMRLAAAGANPQHSGQRARVSPHRHRCNSFEGTRPSHNTWRHPFLCVASTTSTSHRGRTAVRSPSRRLSGFADVPSALYAAWENGRMEATVQIGRRSARNQMLRSWIYVTTESSDPRSGGGEVNELGTHSHHKNQLTLARWRIHRLSSLLFPHVATLKPTSPTL